MFDWLNRIWVNQTNKSKKEKKMKRVKLNQERRGNFGELEIGKF